MIDKTINLFSLKKKEGKFKLDCDNKIKSKYKEYNPLLDKNLNPFFSLKSNERTLKKEDLLQIKVLLFMIIFIKNHLYHF